MPIWSCLIDRSIQEKRAGFIAGFFLYYSRDPSRGSGMGVSGTPRQEEYTRLTQLWGQPGLLYDLFRPWNKYKLTVDKMYPDGFY